MQPHEERVVAEHEELSLRKERLHLFVTTNPIFSKLPEEERRLMFRQLTVMDEYEAILHQRIRNFSVVNSPHGETDGEET
jgi:hypothetical protein